jgi:hypothetical protein
MDGMDGMDGMADQAMEGSCIRLDTPPAMKVVQEGTVRRSAHIFTE